MKLKEVFGNKRIVAVAGEKQTDKLSS